MTFPYVPLELSPSGAATKRGFICRSAVVGKPVAQGVMLGASHELVHKGLSLSEQ